MGVAVISILSGSFWLKNHFLGHCVVEIWHKFFAEIHCKLYHYLYNVHKMGRKFHCTSTTNCTNISVSTQLFLPNKGHSTRNWTINQRDHTIMKLSDDIINLAWNR